MLRGEAFEAALTAFCADGRPRRGCACSRRTARAGLRRMLTSVYETLRSAGRELVLELGERPGLEERLAELDEAARCLAEDAAATEPQRARPPQALVLTQARPPERLLDLTALRARGERAATYEEARKAVEQAALDELAARDRELLQELLHGVRGPPTRRRRTASRRSTSRISSSARATCSADDTRSASASSCASARSWSTSSRTRTGSSAS